MERCFADNITSGKCDALTVKDCEGCAFYKTEAQVTRERQQAAERLKKLGIYDDYKSKYSIE